jgi:H+-transporting ATPase
MYLKLSVAGHLTIFLTRTRGPFWSTRPARILWIAVLGTQALATLIAVYGVFMAPLGWGWAGFVWGYALAWFLVNDCAKLIAYRILDPAQPIPEARPASIPAQGATRAGSGRDAAPQPKAPDAVSTATRVETLLHTSLGDILAAGIVKDPAAAGRLITEALAQAEPPGAAATPPDGVAAPVPAAEAPSEPKPPAAAPVRHPRKPARPAGRRK